MPLRSGADGDPRGISQDFLCGHHGRRFTDAVRQHARSHRLRQRALASSEITDGTSNTAIVAEVTDGGPWFAGGAGTARRIDDWIENEDLESTTRAEATSLMADGSVQFLSSTTDPSDSPPPGRRHRGRTRRSTWTVAMKPLRWQYKRPPPKRSRAATAEPAPPEKEEEAKLVARRRPHPRKRRRPRLPQPRAAAVNARGFRCASRWRHATGRRSASAARVARENW